MLRGALDRHWRVAPKQTPRFADDLFSVARLGQDVIGASEHHTVGVLSVAVPRYGKHGNIACARIRPQTPAEFDTVEPWHCDIGQDQLRRFGQRLVERLVTVVCLVDAKPVAFQCDRVELTRREIILDDEHKRRGAGHLRG